MIQHDIIAMQFVIDIDVNRLNLIKKKTNNYSGQLNKKGKANICL